MKIGLTAYDVHAVEFVALAVATDEAGTVLTMWHGATWASVAGGDRAQAGDGTVEVDSEDPPPVRWRPVTGAAGPGDAVVVVQEVDVAECRRDAANASTEASSATPVTTPITSAPSSRGVAIAAASAASP